MQYKINRTIHNESKLKRKFEDIPTPFLGGGYSQDKQMAAQLACFAPGNVTFSGGSKSTIYFSNAVSFTDIQKSLNVDVSGSLSIGLFSAKASSSYALFIEQKQYDQSIFYVETVDLPSQDWQPLHYGVDALSALGQSVYRLGPAQFRDVCGNQLVDQIQLGANLNVAIKIKFSSFYERQTFIQHTSGSWGDLLSASATITRVTTEYMLTGNLEFSAYQSGGDPTQLARIFSAGPSHYYVVSCSLNNLDACKSVIDGVINYAQNDFPAQIDFRNGTVLGSAAPLSYTMLDVSELGLDTGTSVVNSTILAGRKTLGDIYKGQIANSTFVKHLLSSPFASHMYDTTINILRVNNNALDANLPLLADQNNGAIGCYFHPTQCPSIAQTLLAQLAPVDTQFINDMNTGWLVTGEYHWCDGSSGIGDIGSINTALFPADNSSTYYLSEETSAVSSISINNGVLTVNTGGKLCKAYKVAGYNSYVLNPCASDEVGDCLSSLGGSDREWDGCGASTCYGTFTFQAFDNPL